jgi:hypothetical protein
MRTPGYSAAASIYRSALSYHFGYSRNKSFDHSDLGQLVPQVQFLPRAGQWVCRPCIHGQQYCCYYSGDQGQCSFYPCPVDCSTLRCPPGLVCCDCTLVHCTTPAWCRIECSR